MTELDPNVERQLLDRWGGLMADNLIAHAKQHGVDLRGMLEAGYGWYDWLTEAFKDDGLVRDLMFFSHSHNFTAHFNDRDGQPEAYFIRRAQVANHAIHLIGQRIFTGETIRWEPIPATLEAITFDPTMTYWERSWPVVQTYNGQLITVYYVIWIERHTAEGMWHPSLSVISIEHLTEFDWLERAGMFEHKHIPYTMSEMLFDFIHEGQGSGLWTGSQMNDLSRAISITRERAEYMSSHFEDVMDSFDNHTHQQRILTLRAIGGEYTWRELPELRDRYGGGDGRAIGRHSERVYQYGPTRYILSRELDADPKCYNLHYFKPGKTFATTIPVGGSDYWGDGLSWPKAEALAYEAVKGKVWSKI